MYSLIKDSPMSFKQQPFMLEVIQIYDYTDHNYYSTSGLKALNLISSTTFFFFYIYLEDHITQANQF